MRKYEHSGPEIEANAFASELLMPKSMVNASILKAEPNLEMIRRLSHDFDVTLTAAAVRYVCLSRQPVMVVLSNGERVRWWRKNEDRMANLWLESEQRLSTCSVAADLRKNPSSTGTLQPVAWSAWFPHIEDRGEEVFECSVRLFPYETILSLLWVPSRY